MKKQIIEFIPTIDILEEYYPKPARNVLPEWYKEQKSYHTDEKVPPKNDSNTAGTIKKCIPVFDVMNTGYIMFTVADLYVWHEKDSNNKYNKFFRWGAGQAIDSHDIRQFDSHPIWTKSSQVHKFINNFIIKTPKNYSCLFTAPFNHINPFKIIDGVVDTDNYFSTIHLPFVFTDEEFEGLIPAGTPIAQVIPFKREKWEMTTPNPEKYKKQIDYNILKLNSKFFDRYKSFYWDKKEYS